MRLVKREARSLARSVFRRYGLPARDFEEWLSYVNAINVTLLPNGRAVLQHPGSDLPVEIRFDRELGAVALHLAAAPGEPLPAVEVPVSSYVAALELTRSRFRGPLVFRGGEVTVTVSSAQPSSGKPPPQSFYRELRDEYDELVAANTRNPIAEIARRRGVKESRVKSWLHRGRKYLRGADQGGESHG